MKIFGITVWTICGIIFCLTLPEQYFVVYLLGSGSLAIALKSDF